MEEDRGPYSETDAAVDHNRHILGLSVDWVKELTYYDRKAIHNLKYYTWVEQQGKDPAELNAQWYDADEYWDSIRGMVPIIDEKITAFNEMAAV
ncbi:MAG: hypothetical protein H5T92_07875 [Synergistales bacterium]|nr:hypothetical protein [Synergistales bacterium]